MSKNLMLTLFTIIVALAIIAVTVTGMFRVEALASLIQGVVTLLGLLSGFAILVYGLSKTTEKVDTLTNKVEEVHRQTNGTLSKKDQEITAKNEQILALTTALAVRESENS